MLRNQFTHACRTSEQKVRHAVEKPGASGVRATEVPESDRFLPSFVATI
jgi:hypothetical protein